MNIDKTMASFVFMTNGDIINKLKNVAKKELAKELAEENADKSCRNFNSYYGKINRLLAEHKVLKSKIVKSKCDSKKCSTDKCLNKTGCKKKFQHNLDNFLQVSFLKKKSPPPKKTEVIMQVQNESNKDIHMENRTIDYYINENDKL